MSSTRARGWQAECRLRGGDGCIYPGVKKMQQTRQPWDPMGSRCFQRRRVCTLISSHSQKLRRPLKHAALARTKPSGGAILELNTDMACSGVQAGTCGQLLTDKGPLDKACPSCVCATLGPQRGPPAAWAATKQSEKRISTCARWCVCCVCLPRSAGDGVDVGGRSAGRLCLEADAWGVCPSRC
jgi:hypothetical protein